MDNANSRRFAPLVIERVLDLGGQLEALVRVSEPRYVRTSAYADLPAAVFARYPGIVRHRCDCGSARGIEAELRDTETPHLLEHVALELMVLDGAPRTLSGRTSWDFNRDGRGVFRVTLDYEDAELTFRQPELAQRALQQGLAAVNEFLGS